MQQNMDYLESLPRDIAVDAIVERFCPPTWEDTFRRCSEEIRHAARMIEEREREGKIVFPARKDIFKVYYRVRKPDVKVCIIGQDPYADYAIDNYTPRATGIAFSVAPFDQKPISLRNMFKELQRSIPNFHEPENGCLEKWLDRGVFLLNSSLTTELKASNVHAGLWQRLVIETLVDITSTAGKKVFMLWGNEAREYKTRVQGKNSVILECSHPVGRNPRDKTPFIGCNHFIEANRALGEGREIDWSLVE